MNTSLKPKSNKNLVSIGKAAEILGVSIDTVRRWDKSGAIQAYREEGKSRKFRLDDLREMKASKPLSISDAATKLGVSASTLRRLEKKGSLVPERNSNGERVYSRNSIKAYLARSSQFAKPEASEIINSVEFEAPTPEPTLYKAEPIEAVAEVVPTPTPQLNLDPISASDSSVDDNVYAAEKARELPTYEAKDVRVSIPNFVAVDTTSVEPKTTSLKQSGKMLSKFHARNLYASAAGLSLAILLLVGVMNTSTQLQPPTANYAVSLNTSENALMVEGQAQILGAATEKNIITKFTDSLSKFITSLPWSTTINRSSSTIAQAQKNDAVNLADVQKVVAEGAISEQETIYFAIPAVFQKNIIAPNIVYKVTAGSGVTITGDAQNPIINAVASSAAAGVSSLQGSTGEISLTAGSGITIDGLTISSTVASSTEQTFKTISVTGQSDVIADGSTDTLTLTAGTGIAITTDASGDSITITSTGGSSTSGFTDNGTVVSLTTSTDNVTLGSTTDLAKLGIDGEADEIQLLVQGNITQTSSLFVAQNSSGTDVYTVSNSGSVVQTGSLTFSSVTTDITTGSGEDLALVANGAGVINLNDDVVISGTTDLQGNVSNSTGTLTLADNTSITGNTTLGDNSSDTIIFTAV